MTAIQTEQAPFTLGSVATTYPMADYITAAITRVDDRTVVATYATPDSEGYDIEDAREATGFVWEEFTDQWDRDQFIADQRAAGVVPSRIWVVDHMEHSLHDFTPAYSMTHPVKNYRPADRWDTRPSCVLVVPADVPLNQRAAAAVNWCKVETAAANGSVYGIVTERFILDDADWVADGEEDACWGFLDCDDIDQQIAYAHTV